MKWEKSKTPANTMLTRAFFEGETQQMIKLDRNGKYPQGFFMSMGVFTRKEKDSRFDVGWLIHPSSSSSGISQGRRAIEVWEILLRFFLA